MGTVAPIKAPALKTRLEEAVEAAQHAYAEAERRRDEAQAAVAAAEAVVSEAKAAHDALQAAAIAGDDVTADELGLALHKIAGAESLVTIRQSVVTAREAAIDKVLDEVVRALQGGTQRRASAFDAEAKELRAEIDRLHVRLGTASRMHTQLTTIGGTVARRSTAACPISALAAVQGRVSLAEYDVPA